MTTADLFAAATPPPVSLSPGEEHQFYQRDRAAWIRYVAPRSARSLIRGGAASINAYWDAAAADQRAAVWAHFTEAERALVREARAAAARREPTEEMA